ncbi:SRPBCC family protein [Chitinophaga qingshengii]|uniref:SRPBCC domain-containing protein n=1 Tax=Chitinophaga qingshengii TaxID=1569794 RepID=A0ABR7TJ15_9BACT|nr:SRPBCC domain-containing protein [Chitinophaga qingshengii]MBC9929516.1 SRPBCC domain-containing protein [Chitinophaga qingshengii]
MKNQPLVVERLLNAPVKKVWEALTIKEKMKQWYFDVSDFKPEVGFQFSFAASDNGVEYVHRCRVTAVEPNKRLAYTWKYDNYEGESLLTFELQPEGDQTKLVLTHEGLETFPQHLKSFTRESFAGGWNYIINNSLAKYLDPQYQPGPETETRC